MKKLDKKMDGVPLRWKNCASKRKFQVKWLEGEME
jgi:hypothetical protein